MQCSFAPCPEDRSGLSLRDCHGCECNNKFHHLCVIDYNNAHSLEDSSEMCQHCSCGEEGEGVMRKTHEENLMNNFKRISESGRKKKNLAWGFFRKIGKEQVERNINEISKKGNWYYCVICFEKEPRKLENRSGIIFYTSSNTASIRNHVTNKHSMLLNKLTEYKDKMSESEQPRKKLKAAESMESGSVKSKGSCASNMKSWLASTSKYSKDEREQLQFERNVVILTASAYTPLSLVEEPAFMKLIADIDPRMNPISRSRLSRTLIPAMNLEVALDVKDQMNAVTASCLSYDLWMTRKNEEIFSLVSHHTLSSLKRHVHLGMPWSKSGTDGQSLSIAVGSCISNYGLNKKVIGYCSDGGRNLKTCKDELDKTVNNGDVFSPPKPLFEQDCFAHVLSGGCKAAVINGSSDDGMLSVEYTRDVMQKCITWTKKSQKGANSLRESQEHCRLCPMKLLTPVKTRFAYLILSFRCMLQNKKAIEYLYGEKPGMTTALRSRRPSSDDWLVAEVLVETMKDVLNSIKFNQMSGGQWLLADAVDDLIRLYCKFFVDEPLDNIKVIMDRLHANGEDDILVRNVHELSKNILGKLKSHLEPFLEPLVPQIIHDRPVLRPEKYHLWFSLFLDPRFVNDMAPLNLLFQKHGRTDFKIVLKKVLEIFFDYMAAAQRAANPPVAMNATGSSSIYSDDEDEGSNIVSNLVEDSKREFKRYRDAASIEPPQTQTPLQWFKSRQGLFPMIYRMALIIHCIPPSQIDNERDFSIAGVFARAKRASMSVEMLSSLVFINKNLDLHQEIQNLFSGKLNVDSFVDEIEDFLQSSNEIS